MFGTQAAMASQSPPGPETPRGVESRAMAKKPIRFRESQDRAGSERSETFNYILDHTRVPAARRAWNRARLASQLRHVAASQMRWKSAKALAEVKAQAIHRVVQLAPERVQVSIDNTHQVGMVSIRWGRREGLHLPAVEGARLKWESGPTVLPTPATPEEREC